MKSLKIFSCNYIEIGIIAAHCIQQRNQWDIQAWWMRHCSHSISSFSHIHDWHLENGSTFLNSRLWAGNYSRIRIILFNNLIITTINTTFYLLWMSQVHKLNIMYQKKTLNIKKKNATINFNFISPQLVPNCLSLQISLSIQEQSTLVVHQIHKSKIWSNWKYWSHLERENTGAMMNDSET